MSSVTSFEDRSPSGRGRHRKASHVAVGLPTTSVEA